MPRIPAPVSLKGKALQLLAARDYTRTEMERKLGQWLRERDAREAEAAAARPGHARDEAGNDPEIAPDAFRVARRSTPPAAAIDPDTRQAEHAGAIAQALDALQARGFLDDQRAAEALVHRRSGKLGNSRIQQELRQKGLDATAIEQAMEALPGSELERAREIWRRKFGSVAGTPNERLKQMRFLASRGFSAGVVHQVVRGDEDL